MKLWSKMVYGKWEQKHKKGSPLMITILYRTVERIWARGPQNSDKLILTGRRTSIIFIIFWDFLMFYQIFFPAQVKRRMIITYKHGI